MIVITMPRELANRMAKFDIDTQKRLRVSLCALYEYVLDDVWKKTHAEVR